MEQNGVKIPGWAFGGLVAFFIAFLGFWGLWNVARADVDNLKSEMASIRPLISDVAALKKGVSNVETSQAEMRQDISEIQKDIKTLLQRP